VVSAETSSAAAYAGDAMVTAVTRTASPAKTRNHRTWPLYWFARLEAALEVGDLEQAAEAQVHLQRLGIRVEPLAPWQYRRPGSAD
jgi:hypothetical protein